MTPAAAEPSEDSRKIPPSVECLAQNLFISAPYIAQVAAEAAFECGDELRANAFVRFSDCGPEADMAEAARRLARWK